MNNYIIDAFKVAAVVINGIVQSNFNTQLERLILHGGSQVDPGFVGIPRSSPQFDFTTTQVKTALAGLGGIDGLGIAASNGMIFFSKTADGGLRAAGIVNGKGTIVVGWIFPMRITATLTSCEISYQVVMLSADGTTAPIAFVYNVALDAGSAPAAEAYVLGAVSINGSAVDGLTDVDIDFGFNPSVIGGTQYPTACGAAKRNPKITVRSTDMSLFEAVGPTGVAQGASNSTINLDDMTEGSIRGSTPIVFTLDEGHIGVDSISGPDGELLGQEIVYTPTYDGTAAWAVLGGIS